MTTSSNTDLQQLREFISDRFNETDRKIDSKFNELKLETTEIKAEIKGIDKRLSNVEAAIQKIRDLAEKVGEFKWWKQALLILSSGSVGALLTKFFGDRNL